MGSVLEENDCRLPLAPARLKDHSLVSKIYDDTLSGLLRESSMRHVLSALVQNTPGVLAQISGMMASRGFNIDSLAVGETENADLSRITFVVRGDDAVLEQVRKQLDKVVTVVAVQDISSEDFVERDLMLISVSTSSSQRSEVATLVEMFRGRVVDISAHSLMIEISGAENKIETFIELMRPFGIRELARTGRIALVRGKLAKGDS
jgi:acetolactate synthase I/III small subunit